MNSSIYAHSFIFYSDLGSPFPVHFLLLSHFQQLPVRKEAEVLFFVADLCQYSTDFSARSIKNKVDVHKK